MASDTPEGISADTMRAIAQIESGGNPNAVTGSYKGLYQLSDGEFARYGGQGSIYDPAENARIAGLKLADEAKSVAARLGRPLTEDEKYLVHQQGVGGAYEHLSNPDRPAWESMYATAEGRQKGPEWAKKAIWGNVPDAMKAQFGDVSNITSGQFANMWQQRFGRASGQPVTNTAVATNNTPASPASPPSAPPGAPMNIAPQGLLAQQSQPQQGLLPPQAPQQAGLGGYFAQIPAEQAMQAPPIQFAQRRAINLTPLRTALAQRAPIFPRG